jgi:hypothetical protein
LKESSKATLAFATGAATGIFTIAGRKFRNQPMIIREVNEYLADGTDKTAYVVARLNARLADDGEPVDVAFLEEHLTYSELARLVRLLISGSEANPN